MQHGTITVKIQADLSWQVCKTSIGSIVAVCDPIGLSLEGDSEEEVRSLIAEGLDCFFRDHLEDGSLERFLMTKGWSSDSIPKNISEGDVVRFDVPWRVEPTQCVVSA